MRLYLGIKISPGLQDQIRDFTSNLDLPVRWIGNRNLHITLIPPFEADEDRTQELIRLLSQSKDISTSFTISFDKVSFGPDPREPRLIWVSGEAPREMTRLKERLESILGIEPFKRPFRLHLTLARFNPNAFSLFKQKTLSEQVDWKEMVTGVDLIKSHLNPEGAEYETLFHLDF